MQPYRRALPAKVAAMAFRSPECPDGVVIVEISLSGAKASFARDRALAEMNSPTHNGVLGFCRTEDLPRSI